MRAAPALLPAAALLFAFVAVACDGGGDGPPSDYCGSSSDCPANMVCEFPVPGACGVSQAGQCGTAPPVTCEPQPVCSCAGVTTSVCVVRSYTLTTPVLSLGACEADGGSLDSGPLTSFDADAGDAGDAF